MKNIVIFLLIIVSGVDTWAEAKPSPFLRITRTQAGSPVSLETAIKTYSPNSLIQIDLIAAVHIGEVDYYNSLNKEFTKYDALLYELIAPEGVDLEKRKSEGSGNILTFLQTSMKSALGLEFQLDGIDYKKANFVHADMTPEDFAKSMQKRGESIWSLLIKVILRSQEFQAKNPDKSGEMLLLNMLFSPNRKFSLRSLLAEQFEDLDKMMEVLDGPDGSTILSDRNKVVLKVLSSQIKLGKKRIGIFYGAGHMPDLEKHLLSDFKTAKTAERWLVAWKLE